MADKFDTKEFLNEVEVNTRRFCTTSFDDASTHQKYIGVAAEIEDEIIDNWMATQRAFEEQHPKTVYYLSMEFLVGRALGNNLLNLGIYDEVRDALAERGVDLAELEEEEAEPALGNGGLGRLAACFLDALATGGYAAYGCGIRYHYGMFRQKIQDGFQVEKPDDWLKSYYPFELKRPELAKEIRFGGNTRTEFDPVLGKNKFLYENYTAVIAVPYDMPIVGYKNRVVDTLRLWDAEAVNNFELDSFDKGEYDKAVEQENLARS